MAIVCRLRAENATENAQILHLWSLVKGSLALWDWPQPDLFHIFHYWQTQLVVVADDVDVHNAQLPLCNPASDELGPNQPYHLAPLRLKTPITHVVSAQSSICICSQYRRSGPCRSSAAAVMPPRNSAFVGCSRPSRHWDPDDRASKSYRLGHPPFGSCHCYQGCGTPTPGQGQSRFTAR